MDRNPSFNSSDLISVGIYHRTKKSIQFNHPQVETRGVWYWRIRASGNLYPGLCSPAKHFTIIQYTPFISGFPVEGIVLGMICSIAMVMPYQFRWRKRKCIEVWKNLFSWSQ